MRDIVITLAVSLVLSVLIIALVWELLGIAGVAGMYGFGIMLIAAAANGMDV